jgi:hypothetical protein
MRLHLFYWTDICNIIINMDVFGMYKMQLKQIKVQIKLIESITDLSIIIPLVFIFKIIFTKLHLMVFVIIQKRCNI